MPDSKITALTSISTSTDPANDPLVIVDVSDTSMAATGTTKKVTLNQLLGASGTATLASATITGDLTVDTSTLKVDSANNRVGIGTASPTVDLEVGDGTGTRTLKISGATNIFDIGYGSLRGGSTYGDVRLWTDRFRVYNAAGTQIIKNISGTNGDETWYDGAGGTRMTLNSTGLGVGVSPNFKLDVAGAANSAPITLLRLNNIGTTGGGPGIAARLQFNAGATALGFVQGCNFASGSIGVQISGDGTNIHQTIDSSGQVGIGVQPSAWNSAYRAIEIAKTGNAIFSNNASNNNILFTQNAYYDGSWKYGYTALAAHYEIQNGAHKWNTAASGTAGNAITWTQAMTLDASGNLLVGTTSAGGNRLNVQTASGDCTALIKSQAANVGVTIDYVSNYGNFNFSKSGTAKWSLGILNDSASTPTFKLFNDAAVGVYVTYGGTSWTATSDERLKDIIEPISNAVAKVGSLRSVIGKFKSDSEGTRRSFLIAQDVQSVLPEAVDASNPDKLGVAYSEVIPLLVAAIKELTARVQTLETR